VPVHLVNPRPTHPPADHVKSSSTSKTFPKQTEKKADVSFFSTFFGFIAFCGVYQRWEYKNTTKGRFTEDRVKRFCKKNDKKSKTDFS
jgi:hypothetical protein